MCVRVLQMTLQQICADVNRVKTWGQQAYLSSNHKISFLGKPATGNAGKKTEISGNIRKLTEQLSSNSFPAARLPPARSTTEVRDLEDNRKQTHIPSYQQINCVDNIIRSAAVSTLLRVYQSLIYCHLNSLFSFFFLSLLSQIFGELHWSSPQEEERRTFSHHLLFLVLYL